MPGVTPEGEYSKCRWAPKLRPVLPTFPIFCPAVTCWPTFTSVLLMCAYRVEEPSAARMTT